MSQIFGQKVDDAHDTNEAADLRAKHRLIKLLYRGVLRREAAESEVLYHAPSVPHRPAIAEVNNLIASFIHSEESRDVAARLHHRAGIEQRAGDQHQEPVRDIFSIGAHCITSALLKEFNLKRKSGPFDWIFSSLKMTNHCIRDDFKIFLDKQYHRVVPISERCSPEFNVCNHIFYQEHYGMNFVFNHDDVTNPDRFDYFQRCVDRFRQSLASPNRTLLVGVCGNSWDVEADFLTLCQTIDSHAMQTEMLLFVADGRRPSQFSHPTTQLRMQNGNHRFVDLLNSSHVEPLQFSDPLANALIERALSGFTLSLSD